MRTKRDVKVNNRLASLENWRNNEILQSVLQKKDNGKYMYSLKEIQEFYKVTYNALKKLMKENNIERE